MSNLQDKEPVDKPRQVTIYINNIEYRVSEHKVTGAELRALANIPAGNRLYKEVPGPRPDKPIEDGETVHLKEGDKFYDLSPGTKGQGILPLVQEQIDYLKRDYPDLVVSVQTDGSIELELPRFELPAGWNKPETTAIVLVPVGYPDNRPQGPFVDQDLVLASGQNGGGQGGPQLINGRTMRTFCWSPNTWDTNRDGLWKYFKFALSRLEDPS